MNVVLSFITIFLVCLGCHNEPNHKQEPKTVHSDTVIKDIPEWYMTSGFTKNWDDKLRKLLNLESLQEGFDSLQIRIWIDCGSKPSSLIVLRKKHDWNAIFYSYIISHDADVNPEIRDIKTEPKSPQSGWQVFSEKLINTGILNLPDHSKFSPNYSLPNDGDRTFVEVSTFKKYRLYNYPELGMNSDIVEGPGKLHQALKLIEKEFNYKRPCQDSINVKLN